jgi:hypothetical protein
MEFKKEAAPNTEGVVRGQSGEDTAVSGVMRHVTAPGKL